MRHRASCFAVIGCALAIGLVAMVPAAARSEAPPSELSLVSSHVSLAGTSNIHAYTASTTQVRLVRLQLANGVAGVDVWENVLKPGAIEAFAIAIPAATLSSPKEGLDKNMHKALKVADYPEISFRLTRFDGADASGNVRGIGMLTIAGVEREIVLDLKTHHADATFTVRGEIQLLMTDFGITPPKAMLGMLKTDPKVTVTFETVLSILLT